MSGAEYVTRRGRARPKQRKTIDRRSHYDLPYREAPDDGAILVHVGAALPTCLDCGVGKLQWAEAGYVPWHRICDGCGSHWSQHPFEVSMVAVRREPSCRGNEWVTTLCPLGPCADCEGSGTLTMHHPKRTCFAGDAGRCSELAARKRASTRRPDAPTLGAIGTERCQCICHTPPSERPIIGYAPRRWVDSLGLVEIDPEARVDADYLAARYDGARGPTWREVVERITDDEIGVAVAEQDRTGGVPTIPACWAHRARFHR